MRFAVGQRPEPGAKDIDHADFLVVSQATETGTPFFWNHACGVIGKSRQHRDLVPGLGPMLGEFGGTGGGRAHLRRKIL